MIHIPWDCIPIGLKPLCSFGQRSWMFNSHWLFTLKPNKFVYDSIYISICLSSYPTTATNLNWVEWGWNQPISTTKQLGWSVWGVWSGRWLSVSGWLVRRNSAAPWPVVTPEDTLPALNPSPGPQTARHNHQPRIRRPGPPHVYLCVCQKKTITMNTWKEKPNKSNFFLITVCKYTFANHDKNNVPLISQLSSSVKNSKTWGPMPLLFHFVEPCFIVW